MGDKRVVYPLYILNCPTFSKKFWSMAEQLITSMTSYFEAGNTVPVLVGTDSREIKELVERVARHFHFPVDVAINGNADILSSAGKYAELICRDRITECRFDVVTSKIFAMLHVGEEYDRLVVDIDTLWFGKVPWEHFENNGMCMFEPKEWEHPLSITVGQILYYRSKYMAKTDVPVYCQALADADPRWKILPQIAGMPWPNSGMLYITSEFTRDMYIPELSSPVMPLLSVEDETPLVSLLLNGGKLETEIRMNVPVAFTDISMVPDLLHPSDIICAHYHRMPKPDTFDITYAGVVRHPTLHDKYSLAFLEDSIASGQYGSMSGILWCYVWRFYFSLAAAIYRNGDDTPVYKPKFWSDILDSYCQSRQTWLDSREGQETISGLML